MTGKAPWTEELDREGKFPLGWRNTLSNLSYAIVGLYLAWRFQDYAGALIGLSLILLATGSGLFHAYGSAKHEHARRLDWLGMMAVAGMGVGAGVAPGTKMEPWWMVLGAVIGIGMYVLNRWQSRDGWIIAAFLLGAIRPVLEGHYLLVLASILTAALSYGFWVLDRNHSPAIGKWGHALWHIGMPVAIGLLFLAQRSHL